ncbi:MAG: hypothetical protein AAF721_00935 [Myxococcota bacterium]
MKRGVAIMTFGGKGALVCAATLVVACGSENDGRGTGAYPAGPVGGDPDDDAGSAHDTGGTGALTDSDTGDEGHGTDEGDDEGDGAPKFDLPGDDGGEVPEEEEGCQKVDFLFVVDSSGSMEDEQDNLLASFPGFITAIEETLQINDFHVMVIDAGALDGAGCEGTLGAGRVRSGAGQDCGLVGDTRYATAEQPDLGAAFTCMANRGDGGPGDERTMDALLQGVGLQNVVGNCNAGFIRDDAILVVTIITDEEDSPADAPVDTPPLDGSCGPIDADPNSNGEPGQWKQTLVGAKNGDEASVVVLGLLGDCDIGGCPGMSAGLFGSLSGAEPAPRLRQFVESFDNGTTGPVCADNYGPFFLGAVGVIDSVCTDFVPPR